MVLLRNRMPHTFHVVLSFAEICQPFAPHFLFCATHFAIMAAIQMATTMEAVESNFLTKLPRELRDAIYEFYAPNRHFHIPLRIQSVPVPAGPFKHVTVEEPLECVIGSHCGSDKFPTPEQAGVQRDYYGHALAFINKQTYTEYTDVQKGRNADFHSLHIAAPVHGLVEDVPVLMKTLKAQGAPVPWNAKRLSICLDFTKYVLGLNFIPTNRYQSC